MRRISLYVLVLFLTFVCGIAVTSFVHKFFVSRHAIAVETKESPSDMTDLPRFVPGNSLLEPDYHIYRYRTPSSSDPEQLILFGDFRSAEVTRGLFESNATTDAATLIEKGPKYDLTRQKIGKRGVVVFKSNCGVQAARIFWTEGDVFWSVQAPTLELAREFEESEVVHAITASNKRVLSARR